tara:strand:- start:2174 stop:4750 length:2577 start_codon:yes stop_codon:yes gene_type:complete
LRLIALIILGLGAAVAGFSADQSVQKDLKGYQEDKLEEIIVVASKNEFGLSGSTRLDSVLGIDKDLLSTPRSVSSFTSEFLDEFEVTGINDLVSFVPSSFTTSFFGVGGSLDIRGSSAENYFRGVKRLNNEGNFPTAVGASDRIDILRGPMTLISGPSKVGGALNFVPKSSRADTGRYLPKLTGELGFKGGKWDRYLVDLELGGPLGALTDRAGFYLYLQSENSDSYFDHDATRQNLFQGTLNLDVTEALQIELGLVSQWWRGHENGGWNRVTQELIDYGQYITGQPFTDIDLVYGNNDGLMGEAEIDAFELAMLESGDGGLGFSGNQPFGQAKDSITCFEGLTPFCIGGISADQNNQHFPIQPENITQLVVDRLNGASNWLGLDPDTVGSTTLKSNRVLIDVYDYFNTDAHIFYFDALYLVGADLEITNKLFFELVDYQNYDGYGFTKIGDAFVVEDQIILRKEISQPGYQGTFYLSPSIRYTNSFYALDFGDEVFDRVDLSQGFNSRSRQSSPLDHVPDLSETWSHWYNTSYYQYGLTGFTNLDFDNGLDLTVGLRYDYVDISSEDGDGENGPIKLRNFEGGERQASASEGALSWSVNATYQIADNFYPYVSYSEQTSLTSAALGDVDPGLVSTDSFLGDSVLSELGLKVDAYENRLFLAFSLFEQERQSLSLQGPTNNQATRAKGFEVEVRGVPLEGFSFAWSYSNFNIWVQEPSGYTFTYLGASNLSNVDPSTVFGGIIGADVYVDKWSERGGIPEVSWGVSGTQRWSKRFRSSFSWTWVDETYSSVVPGILLPKYDLLNVNFIYEFDEFQLGVYFSNIGDRRYFKGNYPSLYGNNTVLPSQPFRWIAEVAYRF